MTLIAVLLALTLSIGGGCDGCELIYEGMPESLAWQTTIPVAGEPGEPMELSGTIYHKDGKTPAAGVILYVYHTDAKGLYEPLPDRPRREGTAGCAVG